MGHLDPRAIARAAKNKLDVIVHSACAQRDAEGGKLHQRWCFRSGKRILSPRDNLETVNTRHIGRGLVIVLDLVVRTTAGSNPGLEEVRVRRIDLERATGNRHARFRRAIAIGVGLRTADLVNKLVHDDTAEADLSRKRIRGVGVEILHELAARRQHLGVAIGAVEGKRVIGVQDAVAINVFWRWANRGIVLCHCACRRCGGRVDHSNGWVRRGRDQRHLNAFGPVVEIIIGHIDGDHTASRAKVDVGKGDGGHAIHGDAVVYRDGLTRGLVEADCEVERGVARVTDLYAVGRRGDGDFRGHRCRFTDRAHHNCADLGIVGAAIGNQRIQVEVQLAVSNRNGEGFDDWHQRQAGQVADHAIALIEQVEIVFNQLAFQRNIEFARADARGVLDALEYFRKVQINGVFAIGDVEIVTEIVAPALSLKQRRITCEGGSIRVHKRLACPARIGVIAAIAARCAGQVERGMQVSRIVGVENDAWQAIERAIDGRGAAGIDGEQDRALGCGVIFEDCSGCSGRVDERVRTAYTEQVHREGAVALKRLVADRVDHDGAVGGCGRKSGRPRDHTIFVGRCTANVIIDTGNGRARDDFVGHLNQLVGRV